jgi:DNA-binding MarR family transcriptional regulator
MIILCNTKYVDRSPNRSDRTSTAFLLAQVGAFAAQEFASLLTPLQLTPPDAGVLRLLTVSPGISQQGLARSLGMHASRLVALIDRLEKRGLVVREANAEDRRVYSLRLTETGADMLRRIGLAARSHDEKISAGLDAEERALLNSLLRRIAAEHGLVPGVHPGYKNL